MGNCVRVTLASKDDHDSFAYTLLTSGSDVELEELDNFIETTYKEFGIYKNDIVSRQRDGETVMTLLKLLPLYKKTKLKYQIIERCLPGCPSHVKDALEVEHLKAKKIIETMDIVFIKIIIGEFSVCMDNIDHLLNKFTTDQSTLCDMEKIMNLVEIDEENSKRLLVDIDPVLEESTGLGQRLPDVYDEPLYNTYRETRDEPLRSSEITN